MYKQIHGWCTLFLVRNMYGNIASLPMSVAWNAEEGDATPKYNGEYRVIGDYTS